MMMKFAIIFFGFIFISSCCLYCKVTIDTIGQVTEKYRFNIIGIMGEDSEVAYVEVWYSEATEDGKNSVVHKWVKPPVIIGGHYSNVTFDEIKASRGLLDYAKQMVIDYSEGGSHYMKIVNHGDNPIEYFIAGTHPIKELNLEGHFNGYFDNGKASPSINHMYSYPRVLYDKIPVYYLLYPNESPKEDKYEFNVQAQGTSYNVFGSDYTKMPFLSTTNKLWTIEEIMNLYKLSYNGGGKLILKNNKSYQSTFILSKSNKTYYGFIPSGASLQSDEKTPLITDICEANGYKCVSKKNEY